MNTKAIFFDIDGTLVPFGARTIPAEVKECLSALKAKGIKIFISSGRYISWIDNIGDVEFDGYVTANGAMCFLADKTTCIFKRTIPSGDLINLTEYAKNSPLAFAVIPSDGRIFTTGENTELAKTREILGIKPLPVRQLENVGDIEVVQLMAFGKESERNDIELFTKVLADCEPTSWNPFFCDIVPKGSDKSKGIDAMLDYFGVSLSETMAFGDGENDIAMLKHCDIGVAMGNASEKVKQYADYITTHITDNGLINALHHFKIY